MAEPLLGRTAFAVLHFLELLVGPRCQALAVANPGRYQFDKAALLGQMVQLAGQLARQPEFLQVRVINPRALTTCSRVKALGRSNSCRQGYRPKA